MSKRYGVAHPDRLDLTDVDCKMAKEMGLKVVISTDAHSIGDLDFMRFGVGQARRGWLGLNWWRFSSRDQRKDKENQENDKKCFSDPGCQSSDYPKPENPSNDRDHQKQESP